MRAASARGWRLQEKAGSNPNARPMFPLPDRESKFLSGALAERWLPGFWRESPRPSARFRFPKGWKWRGLRKNPRWPCHRAINKRREARPPAAACEPRYPRGRRATYLALAWNARWDRWRAATRR